MRVSRRLLSFGLLFAFACGNQAAQPSAEPATLPAPAPDPGPHVLTRAQVMAQAVHRCPPPEQNAEAMERAQCPAPEEYVRGDGIASGADLGPIPESAPLPEWDMNHLFDYACAYACASEDSEARLLMWQIIEDTRPLRNHGALLLVRDSEHDAKWTLVQMYRHATNHWWNIPGGRGPQPILRTSAAPTAEEIDAMLARNDWQWEDEVYADGEETVRGFAVKAANVLDEVWGEVLGTPTRTFEENVEFPAY